jgi:hypothetical protein
MHGDSEAAALKFNLTRPWQLLNEGKSKQLDVLSSDHSILSSS